MPLVSCLGSFKRPFFFLFRRIPYAFTVETHAFVQSSEEHSEEHKTTTKYLGGTDIVYYVCAAHQ